MNKQFGPYDGMSGTPDGRQPAPKPEPVESPASTEEPEVESEQDEPERKVAKHQGAGWYVLSPPFDGNEKVRGEDNVPDGYEVVDEQE